MKFSKKKGLFKRSKEKRLFRNLSRTLLQYIKGKKYSPLTKEELQKELCIDPMHHELFSEVLESLVKDKFISCENGRYLIPGKVDVATGKISIHHKKGFGFLSWDGGADIFIPKQRTKGAVDGDEVEVEISKKVSPKGPEGSVIAILKRSKTHLAGTIIEKKKGCFVAFSPAFGSDKHILIKSKKRLSIGDRVICKVTNWEAEHGSIEAELDQKLGNMDDPSIDVTCAIEEFELPDGFSKEALSEAKSYGKSVSKEEAKKRLDLTSTECVTIDPTTAKDFDDAISLEKDDKGHFHLGVHIADVAHYVKSGMNLDKEAFQRCNSTYFPGEVVPMLPKELSNELCSLKPKVLRLTQSVFAEFDKEGTLVKSRVERAVIKSAKRFTYDEALLVLEKKKKSKHSPLLDRMVELCHLLKKKRMARGSIDFAMPENVILVDEKGSPSGMHRVEYDITHQMIEEFMLKANEIVAIELNKRGKNLIYRVHEEPSEETFQDFYAFARSLGFKLSKAPDHKEIQNLFLEAKKTAFSHQLSVAFIRSMKLAAYAQENLGHYGLALEHYCHFTSPIRRYTDLIIQRLLFNELDPNTNLIKISDACSAKERVSFRAESSVIVLKKLRLAEKHFQEDASCIYEAVITKIKPFALFFEVEKFGLEGTFHVSDMGNDYYEYNPNRMSFKGRRTGKRFSAGDKIQVRLDKIDLLTREALWALA